jgi:hypothetical protein
VSVRIAEGRSGRERTGQAIGALARGIDPSREGTSPLRANVDTKPARSRAISTATVVGVEEAHAVLARLTRIEQLDRSGAPVPELLEELRALVGEAERWARREGDDRAWEAVAACEAAVLDQVR